MALIAAALAAGAVAHAAPREPTSTVQQSVPPPTTTPPPGATPPVLPPLPGPFPVSPIHPRLPGDPVRLESAVIVGQVVDNTGRPVPKAAVRLLADSVLETTLTDSRGRFAFRTIPPGEAVIVAERHGYFAGGFGQRRAGGQPLPIRLVAGQVLTDIRVELYRAGIITGAVADDAGDPVVGVTVAAFRREFANGVWRFVESAHAATDDRGVYRLHGLHPGEYIVGVPAHVFTQPPDRVAGETEPTIFSALTAPRDDGAEGTFMSQFYPATPHEILALPIKLTSAETRYAVDFHLPLVPSFAVRGRLTGSIEGASGIPVRLVAMAHGTTSGILVAETQSESDGSFRFLRVPSARYELQVSHFPREGPMQWARVEVDLAGAGADLGDVSLQSAASVRVAVRVAATRSEGDVDAAAAGRDDDLAAPDMTRATIRVTLTPAVAGPAPAIVVGAPSADFDILGVVPGAYFVRVDALPPGYAIEALSVDGMNALDGPVDVSGAGSALDLTITARPSRLIGAVRDARKLPVAGAVVLVLPVAENGQSVWAPNRIRETRTSAAGVFTVDGLPPGSYLVVAVDDATAEGWQDPGNLARLRTLATRVTVGTGKLATIDLVIKVV